MPRSQPSSARRARCSPRRSSRWRPPANRAACSPCPRRFPEMAARKSPATRLEAAHAAVREIDKKLAQVDAAKVTALLADDDQGAAQLEAKAEELRRLQTVGREKIRLLEVECERAENERRDREKE